MLDTGTFDFNLRKQFKVWFSSNPEVFMNPLNQLRLVRAKNDNPDAIITLVFSSEMLTEEAVSELKEFCAKHGFKSLDIDTAPELKDEALFPEDKKILDMTKLELKKYREGAGGNLAAASDMVRLIVPILEKCGIYSDLDAVLQTKGSSKTITLTTPIAFPTTVGINNDVIACAVALGRKIHPRAEEIIRFLQQEIIDRSTNIEKYFDREDSPMFYPYQAFKKSGLSQDIYGFRQFIDEGDIKSWFSSLTPEMLDKIGAPNKNYAAMSNEEFADVLRLMSFNASLKDLFGNALNRKNFPFSKSSDNFKLAKFKLNDIEKLKAILLEEKFEEGYPGITTEELENLKRKIADLKEAADILAPDFFVKLQKHVLNQQLLNSVIDISGPAIYGALFTNISENSQVSEDDLKRKFSVSCLPFYEYHKLGAEYDEKKYNFVPGQGGIDIFKAGYKFLGAIQDISWSKLGSKKLKERDEELDDASKKIQKAWRKFTEKRDSENPSDRDR